MMSQSTQTNFMSHSMNHVVQLQHSNLSDSLFPNALKLEHHSSFNITSKTVSFKVNPVSMPDLVMFYF